MWKLLISRPLVTVYIVLTAIAAIGLIVFPLLNTANTIYNLIGAVIGCLIILTAAYLTKKTLNRNGH